MILALVAREIPKYGFVGIFPAVGLDLSHGSIDNTTLKLFTESIPEGVVGAGEEGERGEGIGAAGYEGLHTRSYDTIHRFSSSTVST